MRLSKKIGVPIEGNFTLRDGGSQGGESRFSPFIPSNRLCRCAGYKPRSHFCCTQQEWQKESEKYAMISAVDLNSALTCLRKGGVIAYPTEAVFGFGCDPFQEQAVYRLLQIKRRPLEKGLILVASDWQQISGLIEPIPPRALAQVFASWPGPYTWVFPAGRQAPKWICGGRNTIALRVSNHPIVRQLCETFAGPIVSTSANIDGELPLRDYRTVKMVFGKQIDFIVPGKVGGQPKPTIIRDAISGDTLRF